MKLSSLIARARLRLGRWGATREGKIDYWRTRLRADYHDHLWSPEQVAKSELIVSAFERYCADTATLHELGVGGARNIEFLLARYPQIRYSGNDLSRVDCVRFMKPPVQEALRFVEQDTLGFLRGAVAAGERVDTVLVADHLIHIPPDSIDEILSLIGDYVTKYVLFHEGVRRRPERTDDFWWAHDYSALDEGFELVHREQPQYPRFAEYELRVYQRR